MEHFEKSRVAIKFEKKTQIEVSTIILSFKIQCSTKAAILVILKQLKNVEYLDNDIY